MPLLAKKALAPPVNIAPFFAFQYIAHFLFTCLFPTPCNFGQIDVTLRIVERLVPKLRHCIADTVARFA
jgi:hypothetical protein